MHAPPYLQAEDASRFWRERRADLRRFVSRRVADRQEVDDMVHDVLVREHESMQQLESPDRLPAWLAPRLGWFPALQETYMALPLGTRYALALFVAPLLVGLFGLLLELCLRRTYGRDPL